MVSGGLKQKGVSLQVWGRDGARKYSSEVWGRDVIYIETPNLQEARLEVWGAYAQM